jgi:hypothetical protein
MSVAARFWVQKSEKHVVAGGGIMRTITLQPVVRAHELPGGEGNVDWSKYTPAGNISLTVTQDGAGEWFEERLGKDVAITFADPED